jgi:hypothetical protein
MLCLLCPLEPECVIGLRDLCICKFERFLMPVDGSVPLSVNTRQIGLI